MKMIYEQAFASLYYISVHIKIEVSNPWIIMHIYDVLFNSVIWIVAKKTSLFLKPEIGNMMINANSMKT